MKFLYLFIFGLFVTKLFAQNTALERQLQDIEHQQVNLEAQKSALLQADSMRKVAEFDAYKISLQPEIDSLQTVSNRLYKKITPVDHRGLWVGFAYGKTNERYQHDWKIDTTCGCDGTIISIDTSFSKKKRAKMASLQLTYRLSQRWSIRTSTKLAWLNLKAGARTENKNGGFAVLNTNYRFRQYANNTSFIHHFTRKSNPYSPNFHLYTGAGLWWQQTQTTNQQLIDESPNDAYMGQSDKNRAFQPVAFFGVRGGKKIQWTYEWGWHQRYYNELSINIPLSKNVKKSVTKHIAHSQDYDKVYNKKSYYLSLINQKERTLFPERFIVKPSKPDNDGSNDSDGGSSGGGGSSGNSCGGGKS